MKRYIASAKKSSAKKISDPYKDIHHVFKEGEFDDNRFFDTLASILNDNQIPTDDLKGNVYVHEYPEDNEVDVRATLSWIFYPEDVSKKEFERVSENIEKIFDKIYGEADWFECKVVRYRDSEYSEHGYDVEMDFRTQFELESEEDF